MMENQLQILSESLDRKLEVLKEIQEYNQRQEKAFFAEAVDMNGFDEAVAEKDRLIEKLSLLDVGFETMYEKLAKELEGNRDKYKVQIKELQEKISKVMEMSVLIQAQEARNKKLVEQYFSRERRNLQHNRKRSAAAYNYYKSLSGTNAETSQFLDSKK